jgi:predicted TPR repeat methyltransferase
MSDYTAGYFQNPLRARYEASELLKAQISALPRGARVIDLGCGDLALLHEIARMRQDVELHGVDVGDLPAGTPLNGIKYTKADLTDFSTNQRFDLVLAIDVLEHLAMPQRLVNLGWKLLGSGGSIYVSAPSVTKLLLFGDENFYSDYTHIRPFNVKGMARLLADNGFSPLHINVLRAKSSLKHVRFFYYLLRGLVSINPRYINAAIVQIGGAGIEAVGSKVDGAAGKASHPQSASVLNQ